MGLRCLIGPRGISFSCSAVRGLHFKMNGPVYEHPSFSEYTSKKNVSQNVMMQKLLEKRVRKNK
jgi:hypothetical protein